MKQNYYKLSLMAVLSFGLLLGSCSKKDEEVKEVKPEELVATDATFLNFSTWTLGAAPVGVDPSLGPAHGGNDSTTVRSIFFKDDVKPVNGKYPVGSVVVKHSLNTAGTVDVITAMVKRGNSFDSANGDWEYFLLSGDGKIALDDSGMEMRGDGPTFRGGACFACHSHASDKDYIFTAR